MLIPEWNETETDSQEMYHNEAASSPVTPVGCMVMTSELFQMALIIRKTLDQNVWLSSEML